MGDPDIEPDTKDWTWTLQRPCPECGFAAAQVEPGDIAPLVTRATDPWAQVLARPDVRERPGPGVWSPLEYGAHVRDVCRVFDGRVRLMLREDRPAFANWDQDAAAIEDDYASADPAEVAPELAQWAQVLHDSYAAVEPEEWQRSGLRSNGSEFTVLTLGQYLLHDLVHHLWDVDAPLQQESPVGTAGTS